MKSRLLSIAAVAVMMIVGAGSALAQGSVAPNQQFGIGINTGGIQLQYALSPGLQIGLTTTIAAASQDSISATGYGLAPYVRFLLEGKVNPYFEAGFQYAKLSSDNFLVEGVSTSTIFVAFGLEYFINPNVGLFAHGSLFNFQLGRDIEVGTTTVEEPSVVAFGFFSPVAGLEWYFDR
ncbi:MAG TPA: hypothetical protein VNA88_02790 [Candidatus Kapabacteria bacterium]|jgi:hypothetical protein|nr:hypothetical protein [Candidatus Kapabacteria bacterium]